MGWSEKSFLAISYFSNKLKRLKEREPCRYLEKYITGREPEGRVNSQSLPPNMGVLCFSNIGKANLRVVS
jgi:hypothetical protein